MTTPLFLSQTPALIVLMWLLRNLYHQGQIRMLWLFIGAFICAVCHTACTISIISTGSFYFDFSGIVNQVLSPGLIPLFYLCYAECIGRYHSRIHKAVFFLPSLVLLVMTLLSETSLPSYLSDSSMQFRGTVLFSVNENVNMGWSITEIVVFLQAAWVILRMSYDLQYMEHFNVSPKIVRRAVHALGSAATIVAVKAAVGCHVWMIHKDYALLFLCFATWIYCRALAIAWECLDKTGEAGPYEESEIVVADNRQRILDETDEIQKEAYLAAVSNVEEHQVKEMTPREMLILQLRTLIEQEKIYLKAGLKLDDVAVTLGTNRTYLSRMMMETYNHTFSEQMNIFRLESAKADMLRRRDKSIESIALSNGFNSANTFNKVFNQYFNCSPASWRNAELTKLSQQG